MFIRMLSHAINVKQNGHSKNAFSWRYTLFLLIIIRFKTNMRNISTPYYPDPLPVYEITLNNNGTKIILTDLRRRVSQLETHLRRRLARRFSIIEEEYNFSVKINGKPIKVTDRDYFHQYLRQKWTVLHKSTKPL